MSTTAIPHPLSKHRNGDHSPCRVADTLPNPDRFAGAYQAARKWAALHTNPLNPFKRRKK